MSKRFVQQNLTGLFNLRDHDVGRFESLTGNVLFSGNAYECVCFVDLAVGALGKDNRIAHRSRGSGCEGIAHESTPEASGESMQMGRPGVV